MDLLCLRATGNSPGSFLLRRGLSGELHLGWDGICCVY